MAETRNGLDGLIYHKPLTRRIWLRSLRSRFQIIEDAIRVAESAMESTEMDEVLDAQDGLSLAAERLAESIYAVAWRTSAISTNSLMATKKSWTKTKPADPS